jgi:hypothetical protein
MSLISVWETKSFALCLAAITQVNVMNPGYGISLLANIRRETNGQVVLMPHGCCKAQNLNDLVDILFDYTTTLLNEDDNSTDKILVCLPTTDKALNFEKRIVNERVICHSLNFETKLPRARCYAHAIMLMDADAYNQLNLDWLRVFEKHHIKVTILIYRQSVPNIDDASDNNTISMDYLFDEVPSDHPDIPVYDTNKRFFVLRETSARGVAVSWIDDFPHGKVQLNSFEDYCICDPSEAIDLVIKRLQNVILV